MRIKAVGNKIKLIRTDYCQIDGRKREKIIASISDQAIAVPFDVVPLLTSEEISQVERALMKEYRAKLDDSHRAVLKAGLVEAGTLALDALDRPEIVGSLTPDEVAALWSVLDRLRWRMERSKLPRKIQ
ncbi:hypothetical protein ACX0KM_12050 [Pseudomonas promysalinigenes]